MKQLKSTLILLLCLCLFLGTGPNAFAADDTVVEGDGSVGLRDFWDCEGQTQLQLPEGITKLSADAIFNGEALTTVYLPLSITGIHKDTFAHCPALKDVYYPGTWSQWQKTGLSTKLFGNAKFHYKVLAGLGDMNGDSKLTEADAIYLLRHTLFPTRYPLEDKADFDQDNVVTDQDAVYLAFHILYPDKYPIG